MRNTGKLHASQIQDGGPADDYILEQLETNKNTVADLDKAAAPDKVATRIAESGKAFDKVDEEVRAIERRIETLHIGLGATVSAAGLRFQRMVEERS